MNFFPTFDDFSMFNVEFFLSILMKLSILQATTYCILTELFGFKKVNSRFVPHKLTKDQKANRIEHLKDIVKSARKDQNFLKSIVAGDETWYLDKFETYC